MGAAVIRPGSMYKIVSMDGYVLLREPGKGNGALWGIGDPPLLFFSEKDAWSFLDRYFTRRIAKVVRA